MMMKNEDLIAEARSFLGGAGDATLVGRLADALEAVLAERDRLARLHEIATERTVGLAAVIEQARAYCDGREEFIEQDARELRTILAADTDAALREVRAKAWDEGERHESDYLNTTGQFCPNPVNPYREGVKTDD